MASEISPGGQGRCQPLSTPHARHTELVKVSTYWYGYFTLRRTWGSHRLRRSSHFSSSFFLLLQDCALDSFGTGDLRFSLSLFFSLSHKKKKKTWRDRTGAGRQYKPAAEETKLKMKAEKGGRLAPSPKRLTHIAPGMWSTSANNPADVCGERLCGTGRWHP